ncbi:hypothetical protein G9A89_017995 [Geosiphon pyriformis]|nr:hypothetical protein G9A89_017995 [Geosiphon pyriformis]
MSLLYGTDPGFQVIPISRRLLGRTGPTQPWVPVIDLHESEKEFGVSKENLNVEIRDNVLIISGESKKDEKYKYGNVHIQERRYGAYTRSVPLPANIKPDEINAKLEEGVLEIKIPKDEKLGKKKIPIQ